MTNGNSTADQTSTHQVVLDESEVNSWFGAPDSSSVVTPTDPENSKPNIFSTNTVDTSFVDEPVKDDSPEEVKTPAQTKETVEELLDELQTESESDSPESTSKGRPRAQKDVLSSYLKAKIESGEMSAFDDYQEGASIDEYLQALPEKDLHDLLDTNIQERERRVAEQTPKEFFEGLPQELQYAYKYFVDGGEDMKSLFGALARVEEVRDLNPENESDQESIVRQYLLATKFGSEEEIDEEIENWSSLGQLPKKATQFKPKLDQMQEQSVAVQLAQQERQRVQQEEAAQNYVKNVFEALRPGELGGLKINQKTQYELYQGLTSAQYPSVNGGYTNQLGHLLEKYQYGKEADYKVIAEALWLLKDPEGFKSEIRKVGANEKVEQTVRTLKTEQSRRQSSAIEPEQTSKTRTLPKQRNIFQR